MDYQLIKNKSKEKGISLKTLAESIKMTEQGLHAAFRNNTLTVSALEKISIQLDTPLTYFLVGETATVNENNMQYSNGYKEKYMQCLEDGKTLQKEYNQSLKSTIELQKELIISEREKLQMIKDWTGFQQFISNKS